MSYDQYGDPDDYADLIDDDFDLMTPRERQKIELKKAYKDLRRLSKELPRLSRDKQMEAMVLFDEAEKLACELSLSTFFRRAWHAIDPAPYKHNWHIDLTAQAAEKLVTGESRNLIVNQPPRTSKSNLLSVCLPAWIWAQRWKGPMSGPQVKFMTASYGQSLSFTHSTLCRSLITSAWYQKHWGKRFQLREDRNAVGLFENDRGGARLATSVGAALTGLGGDCLVEGSLVSTPTGPRRIEELCAGDLVSGFDFLRGEAVSSRVVATRRLVKDELYEIRTSSGNTLRCTGNHPIFVSGVGFVAADKLGLGDRLLLEDEAQSGIQSDLRQLPSKLPERFMRYAQSDTPWQQGQLLFKKLFFGAPRRQIRKAVRYVRDAEIRSVFKILFARLRSEVYSRPTQEKNVPQMQQFISRGYDLLLAFLRPCGSFGTNARGAKLQFQGPGEIFQSVQENNPFYPYTRRPQMCVVPETGRQNVFYAPDNGQKAPTIAATGTPHQRRYEEQYAAEFDNVMRGLPQATSPRDSATITSIQKHSGGENAFYDIQVERICNFFAEHVLVHNCIIIDDPHNTQEVESEASRQSVINWYSQSLSTRLNDMTTGVKLLVMQRQQEEDMTGYLLSTEPEMWDHIVFRMRYEANPFLPYDPRGLGDDGDQLYGLDGKGEVIIGSPLAEAEGTLLWPARMPEDAVTSLEKTLGTYGTAGQMQQRPSTKGGGIIKAKDWQLFPPPGQEDDWKRDGVLCWPPFDFIVASLDGAYTESEINDPSALTMWGIWYDRAGNPRVVAMHAWEDFLSFNRLVTRVGNNCRKFKPDVLLIEAKASGISVAQEIQRVYRDATWSTILCPVKGDKVARAISIQGLYEQGLIFAPDREWSQLLIDRCAQFPKGKRKDIVDSTTQAIRWMRDNGLIARKEEHARAQQDALPRPGYTLESDPPYDI